MRKKIPIKKAMKPIVFLYAGFLETHAFDSVFNGASAFDRSLLWASSLLEDGRVEKIVILETEENAAKVEKSAQNVHIKKEILMFKKSESWNTQTLISFG